MTFLNEFLCQLLKRRLQENGDDERAWFYLARYAKTEREQKIYLSQVLRINPQNHTALGLLQKLEDKHPFYKPRSWWKSPPFTIFVILLGVLASIATIWGMFFSKPLSEVINPSAIIYINKVDYQGSGLGILKKTPPSESDISRKNLSISSLPMGNLLKIFVTNRTQTTTIISKKLPIKVNSCLPPSTDSNLLELNTGGSGYLRDFIVNLPVPCKPGIIWAELVGNSTPLPDFFYLAQNETEAFSIEIKLREPGIYDLTPGIEYTYKNETLQFWTDYHAIVNMPRKATIWTITNEDPGYINLGLCNFNSSLSTIPNIKSFYFCDY